MRRPLLLVCLLSLFILPSADPADAAAPSKPVSDAINKGATDGSGCLPQGDKATFDTFRGCIAQHTKAPAVKGAQADAYRLGLQAQSWLLVNLQSLKAMDAADKASGDDKAAAEKSANVLQEAAHDYFVTMRGLQGKVKVDDASLCGALGLPYEQLKDYFDFYDHWQ
ncbi:MAG TPA: hypothetical protein VM639_09330 [Dongiaceae bacterium]|nr:hypothetical protein [Dongiaceae bacterium]